MFQTFSYVISHNTFIHKMSDAYILFWITDLSHWIGEI